MSEANSRPEGTSSLFWTCVSIVYALIVLFPIIWMALMMVKPNEAMFARPTEWLFVPTLQHFEYVLAQGFHWSLLNSFLLCTLSTALVVVIGTPAAYAFARFEMKAKDDLFLFILASRMAPPICLVIPFYLIFAKVGLLDTFLGLTLAYMTFNLSFYVWVLRSFCRDLPVELEEAAALEGCMDLVHVERHLAEPDDVRPELTHRLAVGADRLRRQVDVGFEDGAAVHATDLAVAAMHVDHVLRARLLVQRVDVLRHHRDLALVIPLEPRQCAMRGVGCDMGGAEAAARVVVEVEHLLLVAMPGFDRGDLLEVHPRPQPVLVAERVDAAFL